MTPDYINSLIRTESGGNWAAQNSAMGAGGKAGHFGRLQFGRARLEDAMRAGAIPQGTTPEQFMASPDLQMAAERWHFADLERQLAPLVGSVVNGQKLDMAALAAMGHLGGAGGARRYVESGGRYNPSDVFGASLSDYARTHGGAGGASMGGQTMQMSTKNARPAGLLGAMPEEQRAGLFGLLGGNRPAWADKANDIGAVLLALSGSPAEHPLLEMTRERKRSKREDARMNRTVEWLASQGRADLAEAVAGGVMPAADAARIVLTPADPMAAINLERAQLELEALRNPQPGFRQVRGADIGLQGPDAEKLFNVSPEGQVTAIGGAGTTVNVDTGGAGKFEEEFAKLDAGALGQIAASGSAAIRNIGRIDQLETLLRTAPTGVEGAVKSIAGEFGINTEGLSDIQAAQALINSLVPEQRQPGSGPMSDADLALFKQSLPRIINQPGGNQTITNTMRAIAQYDAAGAAIVQQLRAGEITRQQAFEMLNNRENPLATFRAPAGTTGPSAPSPSGARVRVYNPQTGSLE